jgi:hypothetical protein
MRFRGLLFGAGLALMLATPALAADLSGVMSDGFSTGHYLPHMAMPASAPSTNRPYLTAQDRYDLRVMALKAKMQGLTAQDGGELSEAHKASLQHELDGVNRWFGLKPAHG